MNSTLKHILIPILIAAVPALTQCGRHLKEAPGIGTSGFLSDHCFQALLVIDPDQGAQGLVARRESASAGAGDRPALHRMALSRLADHAVKEAVRSGALNGKAAADRALYREGILMRISGFTGRGRTVFTYYNENHSLVVGYRLCATGLKKQDSRHNNRTGGITCHIEALMVNSARQKGPSPQSCCFLPS